MRRVRIEAIRFLAALMALCVGGPVAAGRAADEGALISYLKGVLMESHDDISGAYQYYLYALSRDPGSLYLTAKLARLALEVGDVERARGYAEKLRGTVEYGGEASMILAEAEYKLGRADNALQILTGLRGRPDVPRARVLKFIAKLYLDRKERDKALETLEEASALPDADLPVFYELGVLSVEAGKREQAITAFERVHAMNPEFTEATLALASLQTEAGGRADAKRLYRDVLEVEPLNRDALKGLTDMLYDDDEFAEGAALLRPLYRNGELDEGGTITYGRFLYKSGATEEALAVFHKLLDTMGEEPRLLRVVSEIEVERGDLQSAVDHLKKLVEIEPERFSNRIGLLLIAYGLAPEPSSPAERPSISPEEKSRILADAAARVDTASEEDNYIMGTVFRKAGQYDRAERYLLRAEELDPKKQSTLLELATVYGRTGRFDEALKRVVFLYDNDPSDPSVANFYGYLLAEKGERLDFAEKLVREALAKEPENGYFLDSLGWVKFKKGLYEEALGILLRAAEKAKDDATIWEHVGDTYAKLSDGRRAAQAYEKSLSIDPAGKDVARKIEGLKSNGKPHK